MQMRVCVPVFKHRHIIPRLLCYKGDQETEKDSCSGWLPSLSHTFIRLADRGHEKERRKEEERRSESEKDRS